jgi:putative ABC transport system permease protein
MKTIVLAWRYVRSRPLAAALNVLLLALGIASINFLLLVQHQVRQSFERDLHGIDVVVGAKGSPLQLILAGVFHIDVPSGNIPLAQVRELEKNPLVKKLIPISLGDSLAGFRIVGTSVDYITHYTASVSQGHTWTAPLQAVAGYSAMQALQASGQLQMGQDFVGSHGLGTKGDLHGESPYQLVGVLAQCDCVLDRLILTSTESVWKTHEKATALDEEDQKIMQEEREITIALIEYSSPLAAVTFPRLINTTTEMQAAAPAIEITRLFRMLGVGTDVLRGFAAVLLLIATVSLLIALWNALRERQADWAMLRLLGASPQRIAGVLVWQALLLTLMGAVLGLAMGHLLTGLVGHMLATDRSLPITGWIWLPEQAWVLAGAVVLALVAALLPVLATYKLQVLSILQSR